MKKGIACLFGLLVLCALFAALGANSFLAPRIAKEFDGKKIKLNEEVITITAKDVTTDLFNGTITVGNVLLEGSEWKLTSKMTLHTTMQGILALAGLRNEKPVFSNVHLASLVLRSEAVGLECKTQALDLYNFSGAMQGDALDFSSLSASEFDFGKTKITVSANGAKNDLFVVDFSSLKAVLDKEIVIDLADLANKIAFPRESPYGLSSKKIHATMMQLTPKQIEALFSITDALAEKKSDLEKIDKRAFLDIFNGFTYSTTLDGVSGFSGDVQISFGEISFDGRIQEGHLQSNSNFKKADLTGFMQDIASDLKLKTPKTLFLDVSTKTDLFVPNEKDAPVEYNGELAVISPELFSLTGSLAYGLTLNEETSIVRGTQITYTDAGLLAYIFANEPKEDILKFLTFFTYDKPEKREAIERFMNYPGEIKIALSKECTVETIGVDSFTVEIKEGKEAVEEQMARIE